ncbi:MAG: RNA polymerase sigma factor RpoD/SigA [Candidatus Eremiobacteraeota bacterium]|nr:RNA polymerase sigma factor RpoD/SigA [Candidatus Eremiobacteraeota bacterium]
MSPQSPSRTSTVRPSRQRPRRQTQDPASRTLSHADALAQRVQHGDQAAREQFIETHLPLVSHFAQRYQGCGLEWEDLLQEGTIGLIQAVDRFDPARGCRFSTYASFWIKQAMLHAIRTQARLIRLPEHVEADLFTLAQARALLTVVEGHDPERTTLAQILGCSPERIEQLLQWAQPPRSLDAPIPSGEEETCLLDLLPDSADGPQEQCSHEEESEMTCTHIQALLSCLTPRQAEVLTRHFGLSGATPQGFAQIGRDLGLSRERPRQLLAQALDVLRSHPSLSARSQETGITGLGKGPWR